MFLPFVGWAFVAAISQDKTPIPQQVDFAIVGARVERGDGTVLESGTVIVKSGKIVSVEATSPLPADFPVIDGKGKTVYPGFIDGYSTRWTKPATAPAVEGQPNAVVTAPATMWIGNRKGITPEWKALENFDGKVEGDFYAQGVTTGLVSASRGAMRGTTSIIDFLNPLGKEQALVENAGISLSFRLGAGSGYPSNILGGIALLRQVLADAKTLSIGGDLGLEGDKKPSWFASLEALQPLVKQQAPALFEANSEREINRAFAISQEFGMRPWIVGGRESYKIVDEIIRSNTPVLYAMDPGIEPSLTGSSETPLELRQERYDKWLEGVKGIEVLAKAQASVVFASEATGGDYLKNIRGMIKRGLDRGFALKTMTSRGAEILGIADKVGLLAPGKKANLVMMDGDFADEKASVMAVWVDGRPVFEKKGEKK